MKFLLNSSNRTRFIRGLWTCCIQLWTQIESLVDGCKDNKWNVQSCLDNKATSVDSSN